MRKYFLVLPALAFVALYSACQNAQGFLVVNSSNQPLEVYLEFKSNKDELPHRVINFKSLKNGSDEWQEISDDQIKADSEKRFVRIILQPDQALPVEFIIYGSESELADDGMSKRFNIQKLIFKGSNGIVTFEGDTFYKQFEKIRIGWFGLTTNVINYR